MESKLHINLEDLEFYEVDIDNPPFSMDTLTDAEQKEVIHFNDTFVETQLIPRLISLSGLCPCRQGEFIERKKNRAKILNVPVQTLLNELDQEDVDAYHFGVIVMMEGGKYQEIACIVQECKKCHHIEIIGQSSVITRLLAESFTHYADAQKTEDSRPVTEEDLVEDIAVSEELPE